MTKPVTGLTTWGGSTTGSTADLDANFAAVTAALNSFNTYGNYVLDTGAANAIVVTLAASLTGTLAAGLPVQIKVVAVNTTAVTLAFNGGAAKAVLTAAGEALSAGMLKTNGVYYFIYDGTSFYVLNPSTAKLTNSISGDVSLTDVGQFFDGPSDAQGTVGTWYASGTVTLIDTAGVGVFDCKLWDGTTTIAACRMTSTGASSVCMAALSGYIASPAANIRISVKDVSSTSGKILFNVTGTSKDSTISVIRQP